MIIFLILNRCYRLANELSHIHRDTFVKQRRAVSIAYMLLFNLQDIVAFRTLCDNFQMKISKNKSHEHVLFCCHNGYEISQVQSTSFVPLPSMLHVEIVFWFV